MSLSNELAEPYGVGHDGSAHLYTELIDRPEKRVAAEEAGAALAGKSVFVTGAAGSIGRSIVSLLLSLPIGRLYLFDSHESSLFSLKKTIDRSPRASSCEIYLLDIRDKHAVDHWIGRTRPDIVINAAALKHVALLETHPREAFQTNVLGMVNVLSAASAVGSEVFLQISTDKAVSPTSVLGATKALAEAYVLDQRARGGISAGALRMCNVLGSSGSVLPVFLEQIRSGGPVTLTDVNATRFFVTPSEASACVVETLVLLGQRHGRASGGLFLVGLGEARSIRELADRLIARTMAPGMSIRIDQIGLMQGEKTREELLNHGETTRPTQFDGLYEIENSRRNRPNQIDQLQALMATTTDLRVLREILLQEVADTARA